MTQAVLDYLTDRRDKWLEKKLNADMDEAERAQLTAEAAEKFSLVAWLPDAARRAGQLSIVSHPSKFSHPSAKTSAVIATGHTQTDGYVRTGNVGYSLDAFGNAAAMDVYQFLMLPVSDGKSVLAHFEQQSAWALQLLAHVKSVPVAELLTQFLAIKADDAPSKTDERVKQVYFPVADDYHLLSILTPSGILTELKQRIDTLRFSDASKEAREARKKRLYHAQGFNDIADLTVTAYGGSKPQNISVLNSKNRGESYLLPCKPPKLEQLAIRLPSQNFFQQTINNRDFELYFHSLLKLMALDINNMHIRQAIKNVLHKIVDEVMYRAFCVREYAGGWSDGEHYQNLPKAQKLWLDKACTKQRDEDATWRKAIEKALRLWLTDIIEKKHTKIKFGDAEHWFLQDAFTEVLNADKEHF